MTPCKYGTHRVIEPLGVLPQAALKINNEMRIQDNELLIDVITLNIDSASFTQIKQACDNDLERMKTMIEEIVHQRGKMQNPVTGSGGMLIGKVKKIGKDFPNQELDIGQTIATLVSLSLTPLKIETIHSISIENDQVHITGEAILFESGIYAVIPENMDQHLVLAALDVAGAPAQVDKLVKNGDTVLIVGAAGKSGVLCAYQAKQKVGPTGRVIGLVNEESQIALLQELGLCDAIILADATKAMEVYHKVQDIVPELCDVTINVVNVPNTEMSCVLSTKDTGIVYFFSMATSFTKAALGAEGIGSDVTMIIGNGYTKGHAELTLDLIQHAPKIKALFERLYT
ncbi:L-erythro-3,5-diaminohexanoate dehydrogenase [Candidatus Xianfuyuplasma coldseepsis]|uniref:Zinc-binding alcohol dehydrogenase family protein n=1 Tax=Candidatus Xianfuyuplasma coldseepsis TaxID=2782163 RepID=A0A7L7KNT1_9MOLU|nr:L-erythro-3,5-diaminohexanoate dehydrogenase [Xianfuyuplasma coldseepsis]QMS84343.1 zinc-binding alcohol dehydrogenase family protein [Xianfuyuplasma coldseepsis]